MQKSKTTKRCSQCGRSMPSGNPSKPMPLDTRLKRGMSSIVKTIRLIEDQRGRSAARAALKQLQDALKLD